MKLTAGELTEVSLDLHELSATPTRAADSWRRNEHVELDSEAMTDACEAAIAVLFVNHMPELLRALAARTARCDTRLARYREGDTSNALDRLADDLLGLRDGVRAVGSLYRPAKATQR